MTTPAPKSVFVDGLRGKVAEEQLQALFADCGTIVAVELVHNKQCAFIVFSTEAEATKAVEKDNTKLEGLTLHVRKEEHRPL